MIEYIQYLAWRKQDPYDVVIIGFFALLILSGIFVRRLRWKFYNKK